MFFRSSSGIFKSKKHIYKTQVDNHTVYKFLVPKIVDIFKFVANVCAELVYMMQAP